MVLLQQVVIPEIQIIPVPVINRLALFVRFPIDRIVTCLLYTSDAADD